jgi:hypothetical protein
MMVNYPEYFVALGYKIVYYDPKRNEFSSQGIIEKVKEIQERWKIKYPHMDFKTANLRFDNLVNFDLAFSNELQLLNMEAK